MAGGTGLAYEIQHRVAVAVDADVDDALRVAARLTLAPQRVAGATVIVGVTRVPRARQRIAIGIRHHQHFTGERVLGDDRDEAILSKTHIVKPLTGRHLAKLTGAALHCQKHACA